MKKVLLTQEEFLEKLKNNDIKYIPLDKYQGKDTKIRWLCYKDTRHIFEATPHNVVDVKSNCPYCCNRKILVGYNDLWTTHPDIANMLKDKNIGYLYSYGSHYKTDWMCPNCNKGVNKRSIYDVVNKGLQCANCITHISYPERLMVSFLSQLGVSYIHDKSTSWSNRIRYDFNIESLNTIIECHGAQHYFDKGWGKHNLSKQIKIDQDKMNIAVNNGIKHYIQLDCAISDFDYIKNSILNSELNDLFYLEDFDWDLCKKSIKNTNNGYYNDILNVINSGIKTVKEISDITNISDTTVRRYLHRITDDDLFDYTHENARKINKKAVSKMVICIETKKIYASMTEASSDTGCTISGISNCCRGVTDKHKNLHWMYYEDYLKQNLEDNYGEAV